LIALRAFEAVGRTGSVRAAGDELRVSHTAISRHVRNLEDNLKVRLTMPSGRGLVLTLEGQRFHAEIAKAFAIITRASRELGAEKLRLLEIWCVPGLATRCLLPKLDDLGSRLPGRELLLRPTLSRPNLERGEADAEIIFLPNSEQPSTQTSDLLARPRMFPVASPKFCARAGKIETISDLAKLPLIHEDSTKQWHHWFAEAGHTVDHDLQGPRVWHAHLATEAARLGQGVALTNAMLANDELESGTLREVLPSNIVLGGYHLISLADGNHDPALATLRIWLSEIFASFETGA
jgi:DNA-binding transcriptional LysR family regulator